MTEIWSMLFFPPWFRGWESESFELKANIRPPILGNGTQAIKITALRNPTPVPMQEMVNPHRLSYQHQILPFARLESSSRYDACFWKSSIVKLLPCPDQKNPSSNNKFLSSRDRSIPISAAMDTQDPESISPRESPTI